jgi:hypothetical protein
MSGYAARTHPSEGVYMPLMAKALALQDERGTRAVIVTTDLIGMPRSLTDAVAGEAMRLYQIDRSQIVFNSSHTHTGPMVRDNLAILGPDDPVQLEALAQYRNELAVKLKNVIAAALGDLQPASLAFDYGEASFAMNRRQAAPTGVRIGVNPEGPTDHRVPVLRITSPSGQIRAVLFAYACHNTTLTAEFYKLSGDYAGFAQAEIERQFPGGTALFMIQCAADQNPEPRSRLELAEQHGRTLAAEVVRVARTPMQPVSGRLRTVFQTMDLEFAPHTREQFEQEAAGSDKFRVRRAKTVLASYDARREPRKLNYPVQVIRFDKGFTLLALAGEVVVDYSIWARGAFPSERLIVAGYSNDVSCYIPSARVLREGGYEPVESMIYYGLPGPFTESVEERIRETVTAAMNRARK